MNHDLQTINDRYHCSVCGNKWKFPPQSDCPGVPVYQWGKWPEPLLTKLQLSEAGYQTGKTLPKPAGAVYRSKSPNGIMWLYDPAQATPKRVLTPAQKAALAQTQEKLRIGYRCKRCGDSLRVYVAGGGYCRICDDHFAVGKWARKLLEGEFLILDSETTSLDGEFCQIAIINHRGETLLDTLVKPKQPERLLEYDDRGQIRATDINGITPEMLTDAPEFPQLYPRLVEILTGTTLVIYNVGFDWGIMKDTCETYDLRVPQLAECYDAMLWYSTYCGQWSDYHRNYRWQKLPGGDHTALGDCLATLAILKEMAGVTAP